MELFFILVIVGVSIFVGTSLSAILFLLQENQELNQDINDNQPPFQVCWFFVDLKKARGRYQIVIKSFMNLSKKPLEMSEGNGKMRL